MDRRRMPDHITHNFTSHDPFGLVWVLCSSTLQRRVPGTSDSLQCCANVSIDNRIAALNRYTLPVHNWQVWPCQAGLADCFIHPVQTSNQQQEVHCGVSAPDHLLIVTRQRFLHTLCHENMYDFRKKKPTGGPGTVRVSQVFS